MYGPLWMVRTSHGDRRKSRPRIAVETNDGQMRRFAPRNESEIDPITAWRKSAAISVPWTPANGTEKNDATSAPARDPAVAAASRSPDARVGPACSPSHRTADGKQAPIRIVGGSIATADAASAVHVKEPSDVTRSWKTRPKNPGRWPSRW